MKKQIAKLLEEANFEELEKIIKKSSVDDIRAGVALAYEEIFPKAELVKIMPFYDKTEHLKKGIWQKADTRFEDELYYISGTRVLQFREDQIALKHRNCGVIIHLGESPGRNNVKAGLKYLIDLFIKDPRD